MACDFVLADEHAMLGEPEGRVAASAPFLITPWAMGLRHAKEVLLMGDLLRAARAERIKLDQQSPRIDRLPYYSAPIPELQKGRP